MKLTIPTLFSLMAALAPLAPLVSAHGSLNSVTMNGRTYKGFDFNVPQDVEGAIVRPYPGLKESPVYGKSDAAITCRGGVPVPTSGDVNAGSVITFHHSFVPGHIGPVLTYMAKCPGDNCANWTPSGSDKVWVKTEQLLPSPSSDIVTGKGWPLVDLYTATASFEIMDYTTKVPADLKPGKYLLRTELLGLHSQGAPQFYPSCVQVNVLGGGSVDIAAATDKLVSFPGAYDSYDFNAFNIWNSPASTYVPPGPPVFSNGTATRRNYHPRSRQRGH